MVGGGRAKMCQLGQVRAQTRLCAVIGQRVAPGVLIGW